MFGSMATVEPAVVSVIVPGTMVIERRRHGQRDLIQRLNIDRIRRIDAMGAPVTPRELLTGFALSGLSFP